MKTFEQVRDEALANIDRLVTEAQIVFRELVLPGWGGPPDRHGFPRTLYGHLMNAFAIVDLLSGYRYGFRQKGRMRRFLVDYLNVPDRPAAIAVQLWRHTLMHTSDPRTIRATVSGRLVNWLLHWGEPHLPRAQHMAIEPGGSASEETINTGALYLLNDLSEGARRLFTEMAATPAGRAKVEARHAYMLSRQEVDV